MRIVKGYVQGRAFDLIVTECDGFLLEPATAMCWREMKAAAKQDGVDLELTSGWRAHEEQEKTWLERADPKVRSAKGPAARPGYSNHQSGIAIDIRTGLSFADFRDGKRSATYNWLNRNAYKFGFARTVPSEPWHWERIIAPEVRA